MNELTTLLDELEHEATGATSRAYTQVHPHHLPSEKLNQLVAVMRAQGGEMSRVAAVIEGLLAERESGGPPSHPPYHSTPKGNVTMPDGKRDICTRTAGNGVMSAGAS